MQSKWSYALRSIRCAQKLKQLLGSDKFNFWLSGSILRMLGVVGQLFLHVCHVLYVKPID